MTNEEFDALPVGVDVSRKTRPSNMRITIISDCRVRLLSLPVGNRHQRLAILVNHDGTECEYANAELLSAYEVTCLWVDMEKQRAEEAMATARGVRAREALEAILSPLRLPNPVFVARHDGSGVQVTIMEEDFDALFSLAKLNRSTE